ncbi:sensor histidine kinase [Microbacterium indicum]|uniref:sensor histidine kinase n=1 Tax=Microbacterium indicum TaxID=358100 RepID=UPI000427984C|nr:histidine kinase [Microbacterium indicum]
METNAHRDPRRSSAARVAVRVVTVLVVASVLSDRIASSGPLVPTLAALGSAALLADGFADPVRRPRLHVGLLVAAGLCGAALNHLTPSAGWALVGTSIAILVASPGIRLRTAALAVAAPAAVAIAAPWGSEPVALGALYSALVLAGIATAAYAGRTRRSQREADRALVARTRELVEETARSSALEERARIARDMHDVLAHSLGGLVVQLDAAQAEIEGAAPRDDVARRIAGARALAADGLAEARAAVRELRADGSSTDAATAVGAVMRGTVAAEAGIDFDVAGAVRAVPAPVAGALAAVAREAVTNIAKHAAGARCAATLAYEPGRVRLEVISAAARSAPGIAASGSGFGAQGMAARMAEVGGSLAFGPDNAGRWVVSAAWPAGQDGVHGS